MLAALLIAAAVAQPLDATFTTAGHPKSHGLDLSIRYPAPWKSYDVDIPYAVKAFGDRSGSVVCVLHVQDDIYNWPDADSDYQIQRRLLFQHDVGATYVPAFCQIIRRGEAESHDSLPTRLIEYSGHDGTVAIHEILFLTFRERRLVCLRMGCCDQTGNLAAADKLFADSLPLLTGIFGTLTIHYQGGDLSSLFATIVVLTAVVLIGAAAIHLGRLLKASRDSQSRRGLSSRRSSASRHRLKQ